MRVHRSDSKYFLKKQRIRALLILLANRQTASLQSQHTALIKCTDGHTKLLKFTRSIRRHSFACSGLRQTEIATIDERASTFWYSVATKENNREHTIHTSQISNTLPCVPTLDPDGPLPLGAYVTLGNHIHEPKPTCRVSVAISSYESSIDPILQVQGFHRFIDSGFTSFQFDSISHYSSLHRHLKQQTPFSVLQEVQLTVPIPVSLITSATTARSIVKDILQKSHADSLDNVQLVFNQQENQGSYDRLISSRSSLGCDSLYYLDALDALRELQREGYVRTVSARNLNKVEKELTSRSGLMEILTSNAVDGNLLQPPLLNGSIPQPSLIKGSLTSHSDMALEGCGNGCSKRDDTSIRLPLLLTSPLAGGLLTDRYLNHPRLPYLWGMSPEERRYLSRRTNEINRSRASSPSTGMPITMDWWDKYQALVRALQDVAHGYPGVDVASIVLRWLLQQRSFSSDEVASVVVATRRLNGNDDNHGDDKENSIKNRIRSLRNVFTFSLSDDEMKLINALSSWS